MIRLSLVLAACLGCGTARAQEPSPTPPPGDRLFQDELDLQANLNVVQGSGARALGMGGAFLARADDATAASWNPAGLSYLRLPEVSFVWLHNQLTTNSSFQGDLVTHDERSGNNPDFVSAAYPYDLGRLSGSAQVSFQRVISFTSNRVIEDVDQTRSVSSSGGYDVLALGTGLKVSRTLRLGLTVNHWFNGYQQTVVRAQREVPTRQNANFDISGWNVNAGLIWSPSESLNFGAVFKSKFHADATLERYRFDFFPTVDTYNHYSRDTLGLDFPGALGFGVSWRPRSNLTLALDFTRTNWSDGHIYNFFTLQRTDVPGQNPVPSEPRDSFEKLPYPTLADLNQQDTKQIRVGAEYVILRERFKWPVRIGYFSDQQFFRDAYGGAPNFNGFTAGAGVIFGPVLLDAAYVLEKGSYLSRDRLDTSVKSHRVYVSVIYRHQRKP